MRGSPLFRFNLRNEFFFVELLNFLPFLNSLIEPRECPELGEHSPIKFIDAFECPLSNRFLVVCQKQAAEVLVQKEVPRVILRFAHGEGVQVVSDRVRLGLCVL